MERAAIDSVALRRSAANVLLLLALLGYLAVVLIGSAVHEPWWDEAQAWLIARDAPLPDLFVRYLRYEGHPPLWYLLLAAPAKLHLPYISMQFVAAMAGAIGVWLILFRCPRVPLAIRLLVPFSFYLAYQNSVVARSYILFAPILFGLGVLHERRSERFPLYVTLLILLANVSAHGAAMSCAIGALLAFDILRGHVRVARRMLIIGTAAFVLNLVMLAAVLWPPSDISSRASLHSLTDPMRYATLLSDIFSPIFWDNTWQAQVVAAVGLSILAGWLHTRRALAVFVLTGGAALVVAARYYSLWHESIFFCIVLYAVIVGFAREGKPQRWLEIGVRVVLIVVLLRHAQWTAKSLRYDTQYEFTGSARAAEFIRDHHLDRLRVFGTGVRSIELQPYFAKNLFANYRFEGGTFWDWSSRNDWPYALGAGVTPLTMRDFYVRTIAGKPDIIVTAVGFAGDSVYAEVLQRNPQYRLIGTFPGRRYWKDRQTELILFQIFAARGAGGSDRRRP